MILPEKTLFFSVGEPSGDQHVARLLRCLQSASPSTLHFRGFGGPEMRAAGCKLDYELTQMAVMGIVEVLPKLRQFFAIADLASAAFEETPPDAVLLADFPGFNWHIAKRAKKQGIPVIYYLPPQLWAWGGWRVRKMARWVDHVLAVLPWEHQWYCDHGLRSTYVGHPFFDATADQELDQRLLDQLQRDAEAGSERLIAILPGSRSHEVERNFPAMLAAMRALSQKFPRLRFLVAAFRNQHCLWCRNQLSAEDASLRIEFFVGKTSEVIASAECAMMVSGSVSLELLARGTPAVVLYRTSRSTYWAARALVRVPSMTLPNLMAQKTVYPEMASCGSPRRTIEFLIDSMTTFLREGEALAACRRELQELRLRYGQGGASQRAASTILKLLGILPTEDQDLGPGRVIGAAAPRIAA